jgi:hypothetical protein
MLRSVLSVACGVTLAAPFGEARPAAAQTAFTGAITFTIYPPAGKPRVVVQTSKGSKIRFDSLGDRTGPWIVETGSKRLLIISHATKTVFETTFDELDRAAELSRGTEQRRRTGAADRSGEEVLTVDFSRSGRVDTIAGERCEVWRGWGDRGGIRTEGEVCLSQAAGFSLPEALLWLPQLTRGPAASELAKFRKAFGSRGLLKTAEARGGRLRTTMTATRIRREPVSDRLFGIPRSYARKSLGPVLAELRRQLNNP